MQQFGQELQAGCDSITKEVVDPVLALLTGVTHEEDFQKRKATVNGFGNMSKILSATLPGLVKGEPIQCSDDVPALLELVANPEPVALSLEKFTGFQEAVIARLHFLVERGLLDALQGIFKLEWVAKFFHAILPGSQETTLSTADPLAVSESTSEDIVKACEKTQVLYDKLVLWRGRDFAGVLAALGLEQSDGVRAPLWVLCSFPKQCRIMLSLKGLAHSGAQLSCQPEAAHEKAFEEFAKTALNATPG